MCTYAQLKHVRVLPCVCKGEEGRILFTLKDARKKEARFVSHKYNSSSIYACRKIILHYANNCDVTHKRQKRVASKQTSLCEQCGSCNTDLTQQEELVSTLLCVFITGAFHLLQVDPIQLELLLSGKGGSTSEFYFHISFKSSLFKPWTCLWERETEWVDAHRLYTKNIKNVTMSKKDKEDIYRNTEMGSVIITSLKYSGVFSVSAARASQLFYFITCSLMGDQIFFFYW